MNGLRISFPGILGILLLGLLLAVLGTLQYRWIHEVSSAERERRQRQLEGGARAFQEGLDQELSRLLLLLHPGFGSRPFAAVGGDEEAALAERWDLWTASSRRPELLAELDLVDLGDGGVWRRFDPATEGFETVAAPADLDLLNLRLREIGDGDGRWMTPRFLPAPLALVVPLGGGPARRRVVPRRFETRRMPGPGHLLVLRLDRNVLVETVFPELVERHFGDEFDIEIRSVGPDRGLLYRTPGAPADPVKPDLVRSLHLLRPFERMRDPEVFPELPGRPALDGRPSPRELGVPAFELSVVHRRGSLDEVVRRTRRRNLAVGLGTLALLTGSMLMLVVATVRARRLARQQVEFVAGLTHELHTPLAAILSAAANLADGVISAPQRVSEYGRLIGEHGKRLSSLVGQALELAGMEAAATSRWEPVDLGAVVHAAAAACEPLRAQHGVALEVDIEGDLPPVRGQSEALQQVVENLIRNAFRHGGSGGVGRVRVRRLRGSGEIELEVEDEGPGFAVEDLPRVFEPFYRGRNAGRSPGSGLGLRLVEQIVKRHGGSVRARNRDPGGASVIVRLPAVEGARRG